MMGKSFALLTGLVFSATAAAGLFDDIKKNLGKASDVLDSANQQVDDINQDVDEINQQVDELNAEFDELGNEFNEIKASTQELGTPLGADSSTRQARSDAANTLATSQLTHDDYSFDIKRIRLGETLLSLKKRFPSTQMMGQNPASYLPDPANKNLRVKMVADANGAQYVAIISLRQDLGTSRRTSCENRVQSVQAKLIKKYGSGSSKTTKEDANGTSYFISWEKSVPGSRGHSRLYAKATCASDASGKLDFALVAKGNYIEEVMQARRARDRAAASPDIEADF